MPQLDQLMHVYASQLFWLGIVLAVLYFGVGRMMLPKIEATMHDREAKIASDLNAAQAAQQHAEAMEEAWRQQTAESHAAAQAVISKAKDAGNEASAVQMATADAALTAQLTAAQATIAQASADAMAQIDVVAAEGAQQIVAKIAGLQVSPDAALKAVKEVASHG